MIVLAFVIAGGISVDKYMEAFVAFMLLVTELVIMIDGPKE